MLHVSSRTAKDQIEQLKSQKERLHRLCSALEEYLGFDIDQKISMIEQVSSMATALQNSVNHEEKYMVEDLVEAQKRMDEIELRIKAMKEAEKDMPGAQGELMRLHISDMEESRRKWGEHITEIQKQLESRNENGTEVNTSADQS